MTEVRDGRITPTQIRAEFAQLIVDDLYGPAGGDDERLDVTPQDRYLVGMLAPRRRGFAAHGAGASEAGDRSQRSADYDFVAHSDRPGEGPHDGSDDGSDDEPEHVGRVEENDPIDTDDHSLPDVNAKQRLFPSSKGMSFAVPATVDAVQVTATWGRYLREASGRGQWGAER
jgi:hypothetical protein